MIWFEDTDAVLLKDVVGKTIMLKSVVFDNKGKGDYAIFHALDGNKSISFICGAKIIMGLMYKYFSGLGYTLEREKRIDFPDEFEIKMIQKKSKDGYDYIDYE